MADGTAQPRLTVKQKLFIDFYLGVSQFNASDAARRAGYRNPAVDGHQNLRNPNIRAQVDGILNEAAVTRELALALVVDDATRSDADIMKLAEDAPGVPAAASTISAYVSARTTARTNLAKARGLLADRLNVKHSGRVDHVHRMPAAIDALTEDELDKLEVIAQRVAAEGASA